jgi:hypothetical protein
MTATPPTRPSWRIVVRWPVVLRQRRPTEPTDDETDDEEN